MSRTILTVIGDAIRRFGQADVQLHWVISVERGEGWICSVDIDLKYEPASESIPSRGEMNRWEAERRRQSPDKRLSINVYAHGWLEGRRGSAFAHSFGGDTSPARITRKWIDQVLAREVETARLIALSFTEADLHESILWDFKDDEETAARFRGESAYFESTLNSR